MLGNPLRYVDPTGYAQACAEGDEGGGCGRGATYEEIYKYFLQAGSTLYEYYTLLAKLNQALGAGASAVEIESLQGSVEAAYQRGSYWVPQASFNPWLAAVDPGSAYRFGAALVPGAAKAVAGFMSKAAGRAGSWLSYVPETYRDSVARAFAGTPTVEILTEDLVVYRHWGGGAAETGSPWFSPEPYVRPGNARRYLALPPSNSAENVSAFRIRAGTTIIRGKVASQAEYFGSQAVGGGMQIYLPDPADAMLIGPIDVSR